MVTPLSGAGSAYAEVTPGSFSWVSGEDNLSHYETNAGWGLCFCRTCGATLCALNSLQVLPTHSGAMWSSEEFGSLDPEYIAEQYGVPDEIGTFMVMPADIPLFVSEFSWELCKGSHVVGHEFLLERINA